MLIDEARIKVCAGHGGPGKVSFYPKQKSGPDGGDGGKGGDVYLKATTDLMALRPFTVMKTVTAENGQPGGSFLKSGRGGKDIVILIPVGSVVEDVTSGELMELNNPSDLVLITRGGLGGRGNARFKSSRNTTPLSAQPGLPGETKELDIKLKLIADFGLVGLPNAGKSSLLNELTSARARVADYPFTTLEPNLGVFAGKILADIPGLIEGASEGKGLGIKFLKHVEKTKTLLHCISAEDTDVGNAYESVRAELKKFNPGLLKKKEIVLLTKSDLVSREGLRLEVQELKKFTELILPVSIYDWDSLEKLRSLLE